MAYDKIWTEGFDRFGTSAQALASLSAFEISAAVMASGEFSTTSGSNFYLSPPLGGVTKGQSILFYLTNNAYVTKALPMSCARLMGGFCFNRGAGSGDWSFQFMDGATIQCSLRYQISTGKFLLYRGDDSTLLHTTTETAPVASDNFVKFDITMSNTAGIMRLWIGNTLTTMDLSSQNLRSSANNNIDGFRIISRSNSSPYLYMDHMWMMMFAAGGGGDTVPSGTPIIETSFPTGENTTNDFLIGQARIGPPTLPLGGGQDTQEQYATSNNSSSFGAFANYVIVRQITVPASGQIDGVEFRTSSSVNVKPVVYSDSAGAPNTLLASGAEIASTTSYGTTYAPLSSALTGLSAGDKVWAGFHLAANTNVSYVGSNTAAGIPTAASKSATYTSGIPSPFGTPTSGRELDFLIWVRMSGFDASADNSSIVRRRPTLADQYLTVSGSNKKDQYSFETLVSNPTTIHNVGLKAFIAAGGGESCSLRMEGSTPSAGDNATFSPSASMASYTSNFKTDPSTGAAWTKANLDATPSSVKVN